MYNGCVDRGKVLLTMLTHPLMESVQQEPSEAVVETQP